MTRLEASAIRLRFVPLDQLLLHELTDPFRVKRLALALGRDGKLRNPPIVAKHGDVFVVLDGATRTSVLRKMGFRDALVQIVDHNTPTVELSVWHHVIVGMAPDRLITNLVSAKELRIQSMDTKTASLRLSGRDIVARVILCDGREFGVLCEGDILSLTEKLCTLVAAYRGKAEVHRTTRDELSVLQEQYPDMSAIIAFPRFNPAEILLIAANGGRVPMGITRHVISGRALGLGIPLEMFTDSQSLTSKNNWLNELIRQRLQSNKIRLYEEPVFVFDD